MSEGLKFGFRPDPISRTRNRQLVVVAPQGVYEEAQKFNDGLVHCVESLSARDDHGYGVLDLISGLDDKDLAFAVRATMIGKAKHDKKTSYLKTINEIIGSLAYVVRADFYNDDIPLGLLHLTTYSPPIVPGGAFTIEGTLRLTDNVEEEKLTEFTNREMIAAAGALRFGAKTIDAATSGIGAKVSRVNGITLWQGEDSNIRTPGQAFLPYHPLLYLIGNNVISPHEPFIYLVGMTALAQAEQLATA